MDTAKNCPQCGRPTGPDAIEGICPECLLKAGLAATLAQRATNAGTPPPPPAIEALAPKFPQLEILECLGRGGMGVVYKARQPLLDRMVALKILAPERDKDPQFAARFMREAQTLARLSHPNIVTVHDFGETDGLYYLMMEYVEGLTLRQLLQDGKMAPAEALGIVPPICEALTYAHAQGVVHRDIKPENILLDKQGRVKIADFGVARMVGLPGSATALTRGVEAVGTPYYMAPEQLERPREVDHRADIYSLGVVFYEMLTGELPLGRFRLPSEKVHVDVRLDEVVLRALEKEPERRYQQASQVKTAVETIAGGPAKQAAGAAGMRSPVMDAGKPERGKPARAKVRWDVMEWAFLGTWAAVIAGFLIYGLTATPEYVSTATVQVLRGAAPTGSDGSPQQVVANTEDFNTRVRLMESAAVVNAVAERMKDKERQALLAPYAKNGQFGPNPTVEQILAAGRSVQPVRMSLMIDVSFQHPNKEIAATVANYFAEEFINANQRTNADASMKLVEDLQMRAEQQRKKVEELQEESNNLIVQHATDFQQLDSGNLMAKLTDLHDQIAGIQQTLIEDGVHLKALQDQQAAGKPAWDLDFVAKDLGVRFRLQDIEQAQAKLAEQQNKLGPNHPDVVHAQADLDMLRAQLTDYCKAMPGNLQKDIERKRTTLGETENNQNELQQKLAEVLQLKNQRDSMQADLDAARDTYKRILASVEEEQADFNISAPTYRIVDRAGVPAEPTSPNLLRLLMMGAMSGLAAAAAATFITGIVLLIRWQNRGGG